MYVHVPSDRMVLLFEQFKYKIYTFNKMLETKIYTPF